MFSKFGGRAGIADARACGKSSPTHMMILG